MNKFESAYDPAKLGRDLLKAAGINLDDNEEGLKNRALTKEEIAARNMKQPGETEEERTERIKKEAGTQLEIPYTEE